MVSYDQSQQGWRHIYNGILSPFATNYKLWIKTELNNRVHMKDFEEST